MVDEYHEMISQMEKNLSNEIGSNQEFQIKECLFSTI